MPNDYQYIELSFINDFTEIKRQIINTVAITYLLQKGYEPTILETYLESTQYGYNASAKPEGKHLLTRITDINGGAVNWKNVPYCDCDDEQKYLLKKYDILIARTGGTTGKTYLINEVPPNAIFASYLIRLRANKKCLPDFMSIFLNSYVFWSQISALKSGSAQPNVNAEKLKTLLIPNCPISIQRKVVAIISDVDTKGDLFSLELKEKITGVLSVFNSNEEIKKELDQQQNYLKLLRQTILQEAVQGKLIKQDPADEPATVLLKRIKAEREKLVKAGKLKKGKELPPITNDTIPFELPEGWVWCRLGDIIQQIVGGGTPSKNNPSFWNGDIPWASVKDLKSDYLSNTIDKISEAGVAASSTNIIPKGNVIICTRMGLGKIVLNEVDVAINQDLKGIFLPNQIAKEYFFMLYSTLNILGKGTTVDGIRQEILLSYLIPLPPLAEQQRIVAKVHGLQKQLNQLEAQVQQSRQYVQLLLQSVLKEAFEQKRKEYNGNEVLTMAAE